MEQFQLFGLPVGGQPHDFVFVAKLQEAQVLRHGAVKQTQGVRKRNGALDFHAAAAANPPHGACEVP